MTRALRIAALIVLFVVLQVTVFSRLRVLGAVPDLGLLLALAVAYREGPEAGLVTGFAAGFAIDLFLETPVGLSALAYALTAYATALLHTGVLRSPRGAAVLVGGLGGFASGVLFVLVGVLAGADIGFTNHTLALIGASALYDAFLAPFVFALTARVLGETPDVVPGGWSR
jgi:rod shape-determining protein MreD